MSNGAIDWLTPEELRVLRAFSRAWGAVTGQVDRRLEDEAGLPQGYFDILWHLRRAPGMSLRMSRLAEITHSKASRITHAVGRLEQDGLVRREVPADDRRGWLAVLTRTGLERAERAALVHARVVREHALAPLTAEQHDQLVTISERLLAGIAPTTAAGAQGQE
ncbi:MarR family winged helix-turn-helix transcriptional regulator [Streptomyces arenae]|uniref:MarR family winged helix-turn-helix transcriptional regulator n=1 Tax=Streptomyces arenae TaxID=29301 RepID=UPI002659EA45|nr:MarR family transcriptional regulator [Streptomyces arenae]MCG7205131.1 MarR family transcriptional regulator [Streptomyces arenae]